MGRVVALTLLLCTLAPLHAKSPVTRKPVKKTNTAKVAPAAANRSGAKARPSTQSARHVAASYTKTRTIRTRSGRVVHVAVKTPPPPSYQLHPDPDRYQTIQKALADRGYFTGLQNGAWGDDSIDAMRRFQADKKIDNDGKIDALSLISLGLGPRHDGSTASEAKIAPAPPSPATTSSVLSEPRTQ